MTIEESERRKAACRSFWSDHPLNLAFRTERQREHFSLKEFVAFVVSLPAPRFHELSGGA